VIDDDDDLREVISWALSKEGFAVHSYADPKEALESLKDGSQFPQLILVDYHMDGMKGCEFLMHKNEIEVVGVKECPVLMISASPEEVLSSASMELYNEILTKPLDLESLIKNIKKYVN
jgi:DNA-binding response OmpR family regulator